MIPRARIILLALAAVTLASGLEFEVGKTQCANIPLFLTNWGSGRGLASEVAAPHPGSILWSADMETGDLSQWSLPDVPRGPSIGGGVFNSGIARAIAGGVAHSGNYSAQLSIETPSIPTSGARLFRWKEPQTYPQLYYSAWYYFPGRCIPDGSPSWWNVLSWKSHHSAGNDPFFALNIGNRPDGPMYFYLYNQDSKISYDQALEVIPERRWTRLEAFYVCAGDNTGHVTLWQDGVQIFDIQNVQTRYSDGDCEWSLNNYSNFLNPRIATLYVDDAAICLGGRCP
jgi:hypothetical protein